MGKIIGIDLGTTNSCVSVLEGKDPVVMEIDDTLEAKQKLVGGLIEIVPYKDDLLLICNEEGKIKGLPLNKAIYSDRGELVDIIAGTFFMCYAPIDSEKFLSLPKGLAEKYEKYFRR